MTRAVGAVLREYGGAFSVEPLTLAEPGPEEVLVRVKATGFCHTDHKVSHGARGVPVPVVLGHEGAGIVEAVGAEVQSLDVGDHVVLTFAYCGRCPSCRAGHPAYCAHADELNFGANGTAIRDADEELLNGAFFGQSSFASHALVNARSAVRVDRDLPIELLGPLGCSIQTGAGAVLNVLMPGEDSTLAVWGVGAVGCSAVIAAGWRGCRTIVALDVKAERLDLARELGATHTIHVTGASGLQGLLELLPQGVTHAFDTTGRPQTLADAVGGLASPGVALFVGGARAGDTVMFEVNQLLPGRTVQGTVQGDAVPQEFIPMLARRIKSGELPIQRLISHYPLDKINVAAADASAGSVIKPVLVMPTD